MNINLDNLSIESLAQLTHKVAQMSDNLLEDVPGYPQGYYQPKAGKSREYNSLQVLYQKLDHFGSDKFGIKEFLDCWDNEGNLIV